MISSSFKLTEQNIKDFCNKGFTKLEKFLDIEALECLDQILDSQLEAPKTAYSGEITKFKYDMGGNKEFKILQHPKFQETLTKLSQCSLLYTQNIGFEMAKNTCSGFQWHVDTVSFAYQNPEDFACTLWVPLTKIDNQDQAGGISYVSKEKLSGKFLYQYTSVLSSYVSDLQARNTAPSKKEMVNVEYLGLTSPEISPILKSQAQIDDFELGDVFLFDKEVIHCSCPLTEGPIDKRRAFLFRFIQADSKYNLKKVQEFKPFFEILEYKNASSFAENVCKEHGESIIDSPFFEDSRDKRLIPLSK